MDIVNIKCQKQVINQYSDMNQKMFVIQQICDKNFRLFNLVKIEHIYFKQNFIFILLIGFVLLPIIFKMLSYVIKRYFSGSIIYFCRQHNYGPAFSATFIVAFAANFRQIINTWTNKKRYSTQHQRYGAILYQALATLCLATYFISPQENDYIQLQKYGIQFSVIFLIVGIFILNFIVSFEFNLILKLIISLISFIAYLIGSKIADNLDQQEQMQIEYDFDEEDEENDFVSVSSDNSEIVLNSEPKKKINEKIKFKSDFFDQANQPIRQKEKTIFEDIFNIIIVAPVRVLFRFLLCSVHNPWMETKLRFIVVIISSINAFQFFEPILRNSLFFYVSLIVYIGLIVYFLFFKNDNSSNLFFEIIALISTLRVLNYLSLLLNDCMFFFSYYSNGDYVKNNLLINNIPEVFVRVFLIYSIFKRNEVKLALLSIFSCTAIQFTAIVSFQILVIYLYDIEYFRIFYFKYQQTDVILAALSESYTNYYIILNVILIMFLIVFRIFLQIQDFKFTKLIGNGLAIGFTIFYTSSLFISLIN